MWSFVAFPKSHELTVGGRTCLIFLFMEALLFGLFTACMTCDQVRLSLCPSNQLAQRLEWCRRQLSGIAEGQGGIDRLKGGGPLKLCFLQVRGMGGAEGVRHGVGRLNLNVPRAFAGE